MNLKTEQLGRVLLIRLNRPEKLNALSSDLLKELLEVVEAHDKLKTTGCFVITGNSRVFSAGADIREMSEKNCMDMLGEDYFSLWHRFADLQTPIIAAVSGHALGGGFELAMMCDLIIAGDSARFALPEISLGVMPAIGGTQRLTRLIGKHKAMDIILTGRALNAVEAEQAGIISRRVADEQLLDESLEAAQIIAQYSKPAVVLAKESVNQSQESGLREGLRFERRVFHALFAGQDQKEGMSAFLNKKTAVFQHQ